MLTAVPLDNEEITGYVADRAMKIYMANLKIIDCEEVAEGSIEMKFIFDGVLRLSNQASDVLAVNHLVIEELNTRAYRFKHRGEGSMKGLRLNRDVFVRSVMAIHDMANKADRKARKDAAERQRREFEGDRPITPRNVTPPRDRFARWLKEVDLTLNLILLHIILM